MYLVEYAYVLLFLHLAVFACILDTLSEKGQSIRNEAQFQ